MLPKTLEFSDLLNALPNAVDLPQKVAGKRTGDSILQPATPTEGYIRPNLILREGDLATAQVILVEAAAAVGKSSLAAELSSTTSNPVWDLSRFNLGSNFFSGTILKAYGASGHDVLLERMSAGQCCLILDAADEAFVGSGATNFESAIHDIAAIISECGATRPSVVVLGRHDTVSDTAIFLMDRNISIAVCEVDFFTLEQAQDFFILKVKNSEKSRQDVIDFINLFVKNVELVLGTDGDWQQSKSFLGYAPVLDSLVSFFRDKSTDNPYSVLMALQNEDRSDHIWELLRTIVKFILDRESRKFADSFGRNDPDRHELALANYAPEHQLRLLLAPDPAAMHVDEAEAVPGENAVELQEKILLQLREHPFLRHSGVIRPGNPLLRFSNVAFRDYAVSRILSEEDFLQTSELVGYFRSPDVSPSPLLCRFLLEGRTADPLVISPDAIGLIVDSNSAREVFGDTVVWLTEGSVSRGASSDWSGWLDVIDIELVDKNGVIGSAVVLESDLGTSGSVEILRGISHCVIDLPGRNVSLGAGFKTLTAGPGTVIRCKQLLSESYEVRVRDNIETGVDGVSVLINANRVQGSTQKISTSVRDRLRLESPPLAFPWSSYVVKRVIEDGPSSWEIYAAGMELRGLVSWFKRKSQLGGGLRYLRVPMDSILGRGRASKSMFEFCKEVGVLNVVGKEYLLDLPFGTQVIDIVDIKDSALREFLIGFLKWQDGA